MSIGNEKLGKLFSYILHFYFKHDAFNVGLCATGNKYNMVKSGAVKKICLIV